MKFLVAIRSIFTIAAIVLVNSIGFTGHVSAASTTSHETHGDSHHSVSKNASCIALCTTATLKDEEVKPALEEQDDEPLPPDDVPYYALSGSNFASKDLTNGYAQSQSVFRPPDLVKLYSNYRF